MIGYHERGDGEPLLMLNGMGVSGRAWPPALLERLERSFRLIVMDNRGTGSSANRGPFSVSDLAADGVGLLDRCGIASAHVFGHSMGATIALVLASEHPDRVRRVVAASASPGDAMGVAPPPELLGQLIALRQRGGDPDAMARLNAAPGFAERQPESFAGLVARHRAERIDQSIIGLQIMALSHFDPACLAKVAAPTLLVHGQADPLVPCENGRRVASQIPGASLAELADVGHLVAAEATETLAGLIEDFLTGDDAGAAGGVARPFSEA